MIAIKNRSKSLILEIGKDFFFAIFSSTKNREASCLVEMMIAHFEGHYSWQLLWHIHRYVKLKLKNFCRMVCQNYWQDFYIKQVNLTMLTFGNSLFGGKYSS
jgi:hypothetical protein